METVQFKLTSGSSTEDFNAVYVIPDFIEDAEKYNDINFTRRKVQNAYWKVWEIRFGFLTVAKQDYLNELKVQTAPQFIYNSVTYTIDVLEMQVRYQGGTIRIANITKET